MTETKQAPSRRRSALVITIAVGACFAVLAVVMALRLGKPTGFEARGLQGKPVPNLDLPLLSGGTVHLGNMRGQAVLVNFFNSWCIPCREEEPSLEAFYSRHAGEHDFAMFGIIRDDTDKAVRSWVKDHDVRWPVVSDPGGQASVDFGTTGQPETYAISPDGIVVGRILGRASLDDLEQLLAAARGS